tara:strand:- start:325 stop:531 length:207 start_codon:yes stop_codon:yes gene_type:complete
MTLLSNIFSDPKLLKEWAIKVSNACGGLQMTTSPILKKTDTKVLDVLVEKFVHDYNEQMTNVKKLEEE